MGFNSGFKGLNLNSSLRKQPKTGSEIKRPT